MPFIKIYSIFAAGLYLMASVRGSKSSVASGITFL